MRSMPGFMAYPPCTTDADCKMPDGLGSLLQGKCTPNGTTLECDFNACSTDATCPSASDVCSCQGQTAGDGRFGSVCVTSGCHTDADCGASGYCSPSVSWDCGPFGGVQGYYCHTCADGCVNDADCPPNPNGGGPTYCAYDPMVGHWACGYAACAG